MVSARAIASYCPADESAATTAQNRPAAIPSVADGGRPCAFVAANLFAPRIGRDDARGQLIGSVAPNLLREQVVKHSVQLTLTNELRRNKLGNVPEWDAGLTAPAMQGSLKTALAQRLTLPTRQRLAASMRRRQVRQVGEAIAGEVVRQTGATFKLSSNESDVNVTFPRFGSPQS
jgi:hypothetical protein